jgi:hypothetical protein
MKARRILWLYCVFAILALTIWLITIVATSGKLRSASSSAASAFAQAAKAAETQNDKVSGYEEEQRAQRATLSAEEAIKLSAEIQGEQALLDQFNAKRDVAETQSAAAAQAYQNHMARLIPVIALMILHIVGLMLFWPRPEVAPKTRTAIARKK